MPHARKVLIIKTGFSEFLDKGISTTVSLGDVLMCTSLLHLFKDDRVTWVTSLKGSPLLKDNPHIDDLLLFGPDSFDKIIQDSYDVLINLEKDIGLCTYLSRVQAKERFGFYFDTKKHDIATHNPSARYLLAGQENHSNIRKSILEILFETVGSRWQGERAILNLKSQRTEKYDIGFNFSVGSKWPTKAWPMQNWEKLAQLLGTDFSLSWQKGHKNISTYVHWVASCRLLVSCDSLGQIVGQSLGKKVITLFGPTNSARMKGIPNSEVIQSPSPCPHMPCYQPVCQYTKFCMDEITPEMIAQRCKTMLMRSSR